MLHFRRNVYLDHNATTPLSPSARKKMSKVLRSVYGNPSSLYRTARRAAAVLEESRLEVARAIGSSPAEVLFTGSACEADNTVPKGLAELYMPGKHKIVSTPIEHPCIIASLEHLRGRGVIVEYVRSTERPSRHGAPRRARRR